MDPFTTPTVKSLLAAIASRYRAACASAAVSTLTYAVGPGLAVLSLPAVPLPPPLWKTCLWS